MKNYKLAALALLSVTFTVLSACGPSQMTWNQPQAVSPAIIAPRTEECDAYRIRFRDEAIEDLRINALKNLANRIARQLNAGDIRLLESYRGSYSRAQTDANRGYYQRLTASIYERARDLAKMQKQVAFDNQSTQFAWVGVADVDPLDGWANVGWYSFGGNSPVYVQDKITDIRLQANPAQTRYRVSLTRVTTQYYASHGNIQQLEGQHTETIRLADYVENKIPQNCVGVPTALNALDFNTVPGPRAKK